MKKWMARLLVFLLVVGQFSMIAQADTDQNGVINGAYEDTTLSDDLNGEDGMIDEEALEEDTLEENMLEEERLDEYCSCEECLCEHCNCEECLCIKPLPAYLDISPFGVVSPIPPGFIVIPGEASTVNYTSVWGGLREGEIWTDKSVYYPETFPGSGIHDGTAVVTIYIWGKPFQRPDGTSGLLGGTQKISVTTNIGDFLSDERGYGAWEDGNLLPLTGITSDGPDSYNRITWEIDEFLITNPTEPLRIWYHLYLDEGPQPEDWKTLFWYSTAGDHFEVRFEPAYDNPIYWTTEEVTREVDAFSGTINWNNGQGLNSATINDNILGIVIQFDSNVKTPERQLAADYPYATHPQYWTYNATVRNNVTNVTNTYYWHLNWYSGGARPYIITVRNLTTDAGGQPVNVTYEIYLPGGGGNNMVVSRRVVTSTEPFRRSYDGDAELEWDSEGRLIFRTSFIAQIMLEEAPVPRGDLQITKEVHGLYDQPWYFMDGDWEFTARLRAGGNYVALVPGDVAGEMVFSGFVSEQNLATIIHFTNAYPATTDTIIIRNLPRYTSAADISGPPLDYVLYEFFAFETLSLIWVEFSINGGSFADAIEDDPAIGIGTFASGVFDVDPDTLATVDILNTYDHGIGFLQVHKLLDGFPNDWYVDDHTEFFVRIFDEDAQNYLLFYPDVLQAGRGPIQGIPTNPAFNNSFWAVGNHELGLTYFYPADMIPRLELPLSVYMRARASNLWTGIRYRVTEVTKVDGITDHDAQWENFWTNTLTDEQRQLPHWHDNFPGWDTWIEDTWLDLWDEVRPIENTPAGDVAWHADRTWDWGVIYNDFENPTPNLQFNRTSSVTLTNRYKFHGGEILFVKELYGNATEWDVSDDTTFHARVRTDDGRLVVFVPDPAGQEEIWRVIGFIEDVYPFEYQVLCPVGAPTPPASARTIIPFSYDISARLIEVPVHPFTLPANPMLYTIEEVFPAAVNLGTVLLPTLNPSFPGLQNVTFSVLNVDQSDPAFDMPAGGFPMFDNETVQVTITNIFEYETGLVTLTKALNLHAAHFGITNTTLFHARVWADDEHLVAFVRTGGSYLAVALIEFDAATSTFGDYILLDSADGPGLPAGWTTVVNFNVASSPRHLRGMPLYFPLGSSKIEFTVEEVFDDAGVFVTNTAAWPDGLESINYLIIDGEADEIDNGFTINSAETVAVRITNNFAPAFGAITLSKDLNEHADYFGVEDDTPFFARIWAGDDHLVVFVTTGGGLRATGFVEFNAVTLALGAYTPIDSEDAPVLPPGWLTVIELSVDDSPITLAGIPLVFPDSDDHIAYTVEEVFDDTGDFVTDPAAWPMGLESIEYLIIDGEAEEIDNDFGLLRDGETIEVTIVNNFEVPPVLDIIGTFTLAKVLGDNAADWGINDQTPFYARVWADDYLVVFEPDLVGYSLIGFLDPITEVFYPLSDAMTALPEDWTTEVEFSVDNWPQLDGMPEKFPGDGGDVIVYRIQEVDQPTGFVNETYLVIGVALGMGEIDIELDNEGFTLSDRPNITITITNDFGEAEDLLAVSKLLAAADPAFLTAWGVGSDTEFFFIVERGGDGILSFIFDSEESWWVYENSNYVTVPSGTPQTVIPFSTGSPAILKGLSTLDTYTYTVTEVDAIGGPLASGDVIGFEAGVTIEEDDINNNLLVTVTNTFRPAWRVLYDANGGIGAPTDANNPYMEGETATVLAPGVMARPGWTFTGWNTAADGSGTTFQAGDTFVMQTSDVTLFAQWQSRPGGTGGGTTTQQTPPPDRQVTDFFVDDHIWYVRGYEDGTIRPNNNITRAEVAMVFFRLLRPEMQTVPTANTQASLVPLAAAPGSITTPFTDVRGDEWYGLAISVLEHHNIFNGFPDGSFRPNAPITRREFATAVSRFDEIIATNNNPFLDVHAGDWARDYILSATERGWFVGFQGEFRPGDNLTRAELVTAKNRMLNRSILQEHLPDDILRFPDLPESHWSFAAFKEAIHTHTYERLEDGVNERWTEITGHGLDAAYNH